MKKLLFLLCAFSFSYAQAQFNQDAPWMKDLNVQARQASNNPVTFQETVDAFNSYWETRDPNVKGSGHKPFKRWETYWKNFVKEDGTLPTQAELWDTYMEVNSASSQNVMTDVSDWLPIGPFVHSNTGSWSSGQGRVNVVVADEVNPGTYYAGAPAGGIWKTTDSGATWNTTTDFLPQIGVSGITLDYNNPGTIYIATGDDDAGDSISVGVMKSTDGGLTWNTTGLNAGNSPSSMNDIYINPNDSNVLWVATNNGVYKSIDAGTTWSNQNGTQGMNVRDIKIKPQDENVIYAVTSDTFYRSTNSGDSFAISSLSGLPSSDVSRYVIDVTPANASVVYLLAADNSSGFKALYKSTNSGVTFSSVATPGSVGDIFESTQAWYDMAFAVSDTNENEVYTGVLNVWKGTVGFNGQATFTKINNWNSPFSSTYTHADIHYLRFFNGELLAGTDGGFYKSTNAGVSFSDLTGGMQISQFYRVAVSKTSSNKMMGGLQDNGGHAYSDNQWKNYYGADGMDTAIDPNNSNIFYGFIQYGGSLYMSTTSGSSNNGSVGSPGGIQGNWITPLFMNSDSELFAGFDVLYKLVNNAWAAVSPSFGTNIDVLEIDDLNPDNIFLGINNSLRKSSDRGVSFSNVASFSSNVTSVEVNTGNSDIVYVTTSGVNGGVFKSTDGGLNFSSISTGLPSVSKNSIKHQGLHSKNPLYLGTSLGVYRYDDDTLAWELFNIGLPNVTVTDIEINTVDNKVTAATYGRGIWQSVIPTELATDDVRLVSVEGISSEIECNGNVSPQIVIENNGVNAITSVDVVYTVDGTDNNYTWSGNLASTATTSISLPQISLSKGLHTFSAVTTTANDEYSFNNSSEETAIYANAPGVGLVVNTFETTAEVLLVVDQDATTQYWERGIPTGTILNDNANPTNQVYGTNLAGDHAVETKSYLVSECYNLTTIVNPEIKFDMAFELEQDWDIVYMEYSIDQGATWLVLGSATDANWYNSDTVPGADCLNCPGAQWTGLSPALTEYSHDLASLANETSVMFRFVFHSDQSVVEEGVIVDNLVITGTSLSVEEFETGNFVIFPNPSKGLFNIKTKSINSFDFSVYDVTGKLIKQAQNIKPNDNVYQLDISDYASGVYFLNLSNDNSRITKKLILN